MLIKFSFHTTSLHIKGPWGRRVSIRSREGGQLVDIEIGILVGALTIHVAKDKGYDNARSRLVFNCCHLIFN